MKKVILLCCLSFAMSQTSYAQLHFGLKGGVNYNPGSIQKVSSDVFEGAESKTGYHAGIWLRAKIPVLGLYVKPELVYTNLKNDVTYSSIIGGAKSTVFSFQKIDIPVLVGKKFFGIGNVYIGPNFQYVLDQNFDISDIQNVQGDGFTLGLQYGGGIEIGKLGIDIRWERGFSPLESSFIANSTDVKFETRTKQIIIGLTYRL
jgi:hypothetical protein